MQGVFLTTQQMCVCVCEHKGFAELERQQSGHTHRLFRPWRVIQRPARLPAPSAPTDTSRADPDPSSLLSASAALTHSTATDRCGEMGGRFDVEQLLVDDLQVLGTPLTGAEHTDVGVITRLRDV